MNKYALSLLCGTAIFFQSGAGYAQTPVEEQAADAVSPGLEEIVVTARKREETLQNVPVAMSAVGGDQLRRALASDMTKMAELAPQVSIGQGGSGTGAVITVRGVSSASNDAGLNQSVAIELDNMPLSRGQIVAATLFDIQQVQILQGPQALFFGKNSPAGVVSINSANPTNKFEGYVSAGYEFEARQKYAEGAISGPISDTLKARLAGRVSDMRGWLKNVSVARPDFLNPAVITPGANHGYNPGNKDVAVRGTLVWTPSDDFEANLKLTYNTQDRNSGNATSEPFCLAPTTTPILAGRPLPDSDCAKNKVTSHGAVAPVYAANIPYANGGQPYYNSKIGLATLTMVKRIPIGSITSTTGYYNQITKQLNVSDWSTYASIWAASREKYQLGTQELRLNTELDGPLNFMLGAYYEHSARPLTNTPDLFHVFNPQANNYGAVTMDSVEKGNYFSAFVQARWNILSNLELSGGARYSTDKKSLFLVNTQVGPQQVAGLYPRNVGLRSVFKDQDVSPEATLTWHPQDNQTVYGAYKTGYKGGGVSNPFLVPRNSTPASLQFQPEEAEGFEAGYKATLFDRRLRFDLTAYTYKYDNLQVVSYNASTVTFVLQNAASARIKGVQGSATLLAARGLTLRANFGYNDATYTDFRTAPCYVGQTAATGCSGTPAAQDLSGKALLRAPKLTYSIGGEYKLPLSDSLESIWTVQGSHSGSYQTATDYAPGGFQKSYWLLNASASISAAEGKYELSLIGRNLTNTYYMLNVNGWSGSGNGNQYVGFFNRPREIAVQATVRF